MDDCVRIEIIGGGRREKKRGGKEQKCIRPRTIFLCTRSCIAAAAVSDALPPWWTLPSKGCIENSTSRQLCFRIEYSSTLLFHNVMINVNVSPLPLHSIFTIFIPTWNLSLERTKKEKKVERKIGKNRRLERMEKKSLCRKCSSETENIFSTVLNAGRSIDSSSENLSGKEEEERRPGLVFLWACRLTLHSLYVPRGRVPTAFSIRVERGFSANLSATTPFHIFFLFFSFFFSKKNQSLYHHIVVKSHRSTR